MRKRKTTQRREPEYEYVAVPEEDVQVVGVFIPRRLRYLPELFGFLREQLSAPWNVGLFSGFSLFDAEGAFQGEEIYDEPTFILRLVYRASSFLRVDSQPDDPASLDEQVQRRIRNIASAVIKITQQREEEIWILRSSQKLSRFVRREKT